MLGDMEEMHSLVARDHEHNDTGYVDESQWDSYDDLVRDLVQSKIQNIRTTHVILEAFSVAAVLLIAFRILYDGWRASSLQIQLRPRKLALLHAVHPAEKVALVIALVLALQQIIFIGVGSPAISTVMVSGCAATAQLILPALFILPYTILVFGVETAIRSVQKKSFAPHGRWNIPICLGAIVLMTIFTWIPSAVNKTTDRCVGSLVWWAYEYATIATVLFSTLMALFVGLAGLITFRLLKSVKVDPNERIAASRMVYYLGFGVLVVAFILPFYAYAQSANFSDDGVSARLAPVALSVSGLVFAFWHCFDRANAYKIALRPLQAAWETDRPLRFLGPNDLEARAKGVWPPNEPVLHGSSDRLIPSRASEREKVEDLEDRGRSGTVMREVPGFNSFPLQRNNTAATEATAVNHQLPKRTKSSYSIFPTSVPDRSTPSPEIPRLPATTYTPSPLKAPSEPVAQEESGRKGSVTDISHPSGSPRKNQNGLSADHRRQGSTQSTATVQIGLRLSAVPITIVGPKQPRQSTTLKPKPSLPQVKVSHDRSDSGQTLVSSPDRTLREVDDADKTDSDDPRFSILTFANNLLNLKPGRNKSLPPLPNSPSRPGPAHMPRASRGPRSPGSPRPGGWGLAMHPVSPEIDLAEGSPTLGYDILNKTSQSKWG